MSLISSILIDSLKFNPLIIHIYFLECLLSFLNLFFFIRTLKNKIMALKPGPKRIATSTGKPDQRQRDNKTTPGNTPSLKPPKKKS